MKLRGRDTWSGGTGWPMGPRACGASCMVTALIASIREGHPVKSVCHATVHPDAASPRFTSADADPRTCTCSGPESNSAAWVPVTFSAT